jgi:ribose transport system permease protein
VTVTQEHPTTEMAAPVAVSTASDRRLAQLRDYGIVFVFAALFITLSIASDAFLSVTNLLNVLDQWAPVGIMACAGTLVMIAGGFDLSVGAVVALSGVVAAKVTGVAGVEIAMLAGVASGLVVGVANGALVTKARINPFMATLASSMMVRGLATAISAGVVITVATDKYEAFSELGSGKLLGVNWSIWIWAIFALAMGFLLSRTVFGKNVFAVGGNQDAARMSGVRVGRVRLITYALSGMAAGIAGIILVSVAGSGQSNVGVGMELSVIAAIVVGGTSILGGQGAIWRAIIGVLLIALIGNGFNLLGVDSVYQQMTQGAIIAFAVGIDAWTRKR